MFVIHLIGKDTGNNALKTEAKVCNNSRKVVFDFYIILFTSIFIA